MTDDTNARGIGATAWQRAFSIVFIGYLLVVLYHLSGPAGRALGGTGAVESIEGEATLGIVLLLGIAFMLAMALGLFLVVFQLIALHHVDIELHMTVELPDIASEVLPERFASIAGTVPIEPELIFPVDLAWLFVLVPPGVLVYYGFHAQRRADSSRSALFHTVFGYAVAAAITIYPVIWVFNAAVGPFLAGFAPTAGVADPTVGIVVDDIVEAYVIIAVVYPAIFGTLGVVIGDVLEDDEDDATLATGADDAETDTAEAGTTSPADSSDSVRYCVQCGSENDTADDFCTACGEALPTVD